MAIISFDVGGTFVKYGLFENSYIVQKGKFKTERNDKEIFLSSLVQKIKDLSELEEVNGIGLSFPGFIDTERGIPILAGALTSIDGVSVIKELKNRIDIDCPIYMENDANCAALAEKYNGAAVENKDFVLITLGTGVGGAIHYQNQTIRGQSYRAGEIGMMLTDYGRNSHKTLHELASTSALISLYKEKMGLSSDEEVSGEEIFSNYADAEVREIITEWSKFVAVTVFNTVVILNPEKVLIGGGVSQDPNLISFIQESLETIPHWENFKVPVEACKHYNDSGLWGAYYLVKQQLV